MMCYDGLPMVVEIARLNMRLALYVHTLAPGSLPVQPSLTISTAESWKLNTTWDQDLSISHSLITSEVLWCHNSRDVKSLFCFMVIFHICRDAFSRAFI